MQESDLPVMTPTPWARDATDPTYVREVPEDSQIGVNAGYASWATGFVPLNFTLPGAGGIPPFGQDMNGVLRSISQWIRWQQAGAPVPYDGTFSGDVGGYPKGAIVPSASTDYLRWLSIADNNTTDPDAGGANWIPVWDRPAVRIITATGVVTTLITDQAVGLARGAATSTVLPITNLFEGFRVEYSDLVGNFQAFQHTITPPGGHSIAGFSTFTMNTNRQTTSFRYFGSVSGTPTWGIDV